MTANSFVLHMLCGLSYFLKEQQSLYMVQSTLIVFCLVEKRFTIEKLQMREPLEYTCCHIVLPTASVQEKARQVNKYNRVRLTALKPGQCVHC